MKYGNLTLGQVEALVNKLGGMNNVERILRADNIQESISKLLNKKPGRINRVFVNRDKAFDAMVAACGFSWVEPELTAEHFPIQRSGPCAVDIELILFNPDTKIEEVKADVSLRGYRHATVEELLAFASEYRYTMFECPIVALGTIWHSREGDYVVGLCGNASGGGPTVLNADDETTEYWQVAVVRK